MLWTLWAEVGHWGFGIFSAVAWAIAILTDWVFLQSKFNWDDNNPHWAIFIAHVVVAFFGAIWFGKLVYRTEKRIWTAYAAWDLRIRWIDHRLRREMAQFTRRR
jgi:hypothetical protein